MCLSLRSLLSVGVLLKEVLLMSFVCIGVQNVHVHIHMLA